MAEGVTQTRQDIREEASTVVEDHCALHHVQEQRREPGSLIRGLQHRADVGQDTHSAQGLQPGVQLLVGEPQEFVARQPSGGQTVGDHQEVDISMRGGLATGS